MQISDQGSAAAAGTLRLSGISHSFGNVRALQDITLTIPRGEFWTLLGPSGSGKSTLLRIIGGYIHPKQGAVFLDDRDITKVSLRERGMGMVFQDYALFPQMTVFENIAYGLRARRLSNTDIRKRVSGMIELNHLVGLDGKYPSQLSGGQQQRVALARSLIIGPSVLLMDEAMGALDLRLRESMEIEVKKLQRELGITAIHVTHDQAEAMAMSDRIVVLNNGRIEQIGSPQALNFRPASRFVAEFVGFNNVFPADIRRVVADGAWGTIPGTDREFLLCDNPSAALSAPCRCFIVVRTEQMKAARKPSSPSIDGTVVAVKYLGTSRCLVVETAQNLTLFVLDRAEDFSIGDKLHLSWSVSDAQLIPAHDAEAVNLAG